MKIHKYWKEFWKSHKGDLIAVFTIAVLYVAMEACGITCPIRFLTGISCAGCGMSRAVLCASHGHFSQACSYHPLFWVLAPALMIFLFRKKLPRFFVKSFLIIVLAAFILVYLIRMLDPNDSIVVFAPREGALYRFFSRFM